MQLLIVDDDSAFRTVLRESLEEIFSSARVVEAHGGTEAWRLLEHEHIPMVLTDWQMPNLDGLELTRRIRRANFPTYTYVILLTARGQSRDIVDGLKAGADDYLVKPFNMEELQARIEIGQRILGLEARLHQAMERLEQLATRDSLTGLLNRQAIELQARRALHHAQQVQHPLSLVLLDVDNFKQVNDRCGHLVGDEALRQVATTLTHAIRTDDHVGRWGGEEFLLLLPNTTREQALEIAERVRRRVARTALSLPGGEKLVLHVSLGVASQPPTAAPALHHLLQRADAALYRAKASGRDRVCVA